MARDRVEAVDPLMALTRMAVFYAATNLHHLLASRKLPTTGYPLSASYPAVASLRGGSMERRALGKSTIAQVLSLEDCGITGTSIF
jgi:hypothetical protein